MAEIRVISDSEAIDYIRDRGNRYACWLGAGASAEAGVMTAQEICRTILSRMVKTDRTIDPDDKNQVEQWANKNLDWAKTSLRYMTCMDKAFPVGIKRTEYFRSILREVPPSFCHHATALLMSHGYVKRTCLTINFDHLLENAFIQQGITECQPIRTDQECEYWKNPDERNFIIKLHGDTDTNNVMNTRNETRRLTPAMKGMVKDVLRDAGLFVIGTAGHESSVQDLFIDLSQGDVGRTYLQHGLMWAVYMGQTKPRTSPTGDELKRLVEKRIVETDINQEIINLIAESNNRLFCFFPIWGAGNFMFDLVKAIDNRELSAKAGLYLDHEMRLREVFSTRLSESAIDKHLAKLEREREKLLDVSKNSLRVLEEVYKANDSQGLIEIRVIYGDITDDRYMERAEFEDSRRAIISPEDTCISAGGGVAFLILEKAGTQIILNELEKFPRIKHDAVAVTSGGNLPVHYIFHAAATEIDQDANYIVSKDDVNKTMLSALEKARALEVDALWIPLMGAGIQIREEESFEGIIDAIAGWDSQGHKLTLLIFIYLERQLERSTVREYLRTHLPATYTIQKISPAED